VWSAADDDFQGVDDLSMEVSGRCGTESDGTSYEEELTNETTQAILLVAGVPSGLR
jgi:hypothetical protein